tara:strand:+ start:2118 stop:5426 length:3309 start_codon:yes stop_codon:yes gene_type:complete
MAFEFDFDNVPSIAELSTSSSPVAFGTASAKLEAYTTPSTMTLEPTRSSTPVQQDLGNDYSVKNLAEHSGFVSKANNYLDRRYGSSRKKGETNEDVVEEYLTHYRYMSNNTVDLMQEVDFLREADKQTKDDFQILYNVYQDTPNFLSEGGGGVMSGVADIVGSVLTDPATVIGMGFGGPIGSILSQAAKQAGKGATTRMVLKTALKGNLGKIAGMTSVEGLLGAMHESQRQEMLIEADMMGKKDVGDIVTAGALTGGLSLIGYPLAARGLANTVGKTVPHTRIDKIAAIRNEASKDTETPLSLTREETLESMKPSVIGKFDPEVAIALRNRVSPGTDLLDTKTSLQITKLTNRVAIDMHSNMMASLKPELRDTFARQKGERISDLIYRTILQANTIDDEIVERAITKQGLTVAEFGELHRLTAREAGQTLRSFRGMGAKIKQMADDDPDLKKKLDEIYGEPSDSRTAVGTVYDLLRRADRETRAMMVVQVATTARNVLSGAAYLTFGAAAKALEGTIYGVGKSIQSIGKGTASIQGTTEGTTKIVKDAASTLISVMNSKDSHALANTMLENTPKLHGTLFRSLQETGNETLSKFTRSMNGLNMAQDVVLRSGVFTDSVNVRMMKVGLDMEEYIAKKKDIPMEILKASIDDSLEATFARTPSSPLLKAFVQGVERMPFLPIIGTFTFPFARFTADALAFQAAYSPANFFSAMGSGYRWSKSARAAKNTTNAEHKKALVRQSTNDMEETVQRISKGAVGSSVLYGAMMYREEHPELKWYEVMQEGKPVDIRAIFPMSPYLAIADIITNLNNKAPDEVFSQIMEGMTGSQMKAGSVSGSVGDLFEALRDLTATDISSEKVGEMFGNWTGAITGRILTPAAVVRDAWAVFDSSEAIVRSTRIAEGDTGTDKFLSAFTNNLKAKLPVLQKDLPEYQSPTKEGATYRQSPFATQLTGLKPSEHRSAVETEFAKHGIETYRLFSSTGSKQTDYLVNKHAPPYVNTMIGSIISTPWYKSLPKSSQAIVLKKRLQGARKLIKNVAEGEAIMQAYSKGKTYTVFDKANWSKLPSAQRRLADEYFKMYYGGSVAELGSYKAAIQIGRALERAL